MIRARALLALPLLAAPAAGAPRSDAGPPEGGEPEVERVEAWPELSGSERSTVKTDVQRLRKARTPEMSEEAREALIAAGPAVVPYLLPALGKEDDPDAVLRIEEVLVRVTGPEHTRVLAEFFDDREPEVRVWAMRRAARFPDAGLRGAAAERLREVVGTPGDPPREAPDPQEAYAVGLLAASTGSLAGLDPVFAVAREEWGERKDEILAGMRGARGPEAVRALSERLNDDRSSTVAGLRLLWACGDESAIVIARGHLDSEDATIRSAAINALRSIVDGDEPLERMPVFDGIERAKKWKERLR